MVEREPSLVAFEHWLTENLPRLARLAYQGLGPRGRGAIFVRLSPDARHYQLTFATLSELEADHREIVEAKDPQSTTCSQGSSYWPGSITRNARSW
jgi:hypothetical protein